jgi:Glycosyl hydrolase catalytic core
MSSGWTRRLVLAATVAGLALAPQARGGGEPAGTVEGEQGVSIGVMPQRAIEDRETDAIVDAGIDSVRLWFPWSVVEDERDSFDWGTVDHAVATNADAGLTTLPFLFGTPAWAADRDGRECSEAECIPYPPSSTQTRYEFAQFAGAAVRRYGPDGTFWDQHPGVAYRPIRAWQVWNEPNLSSFWRPQVDPQAYASLVGITSAEIRRLDPDAEIVLAGLTGKVTNSLRMSTRDFLDGLYSVSEVSGSFDGIAVHPYDRNTRGVIEQVKAARAAASEHGDDAEIWVTELGWASAGKRRLGLVKSLQGQARRLKKSFTWLIDHRDRWGIRAAYWYSWRDTERGKPVCSWCPASGLVDRDGERKPAYAALQRVTGG